MYNRLALCLRESALGQVQLEAMPFRGLAQARALFSANLGRRHFFVSYCCRGHYETLGIPHGATKSQIKSSFYKLSKQYHPDMNKDPKGKEIFHAVTEAYTVLGDDRQRREYDRSLGRASAQAPYDTRRRRGATHAWAGTRRPGTYQHPPGSQQHPHPGFQQQPGARANTADPFWSPTAHQATGRARKAYAEHREADRVRRESGFWRAVQVLAVVIAVGSVGGWSATTG